MRQLNYKVFITWYNVPLYLRWIEPINIWKYFKVLFQQFSEFFPFPHDTFGNGLFWLKKILSQKHNQPKLNVFFWLKPNTENVFHKKLFNLELLQRFAHIIFVIKLWEKLSRFIVDQNIELFQETEMSWKIVDSNIRRQILWSNVKKSNKIAQYEKTFFLILCNFWPRQLKFHLWKEQWVLISASIHF